MISRKVTFRPIAHTWGESLQKTLRASSYDNHSRWYRSTVATFVCQLISMFYRATCSCGFLVSVTRRCELTLDYLILVRDLNLQLREQKVNEWTNKVECLNIFKLAPLTLGLIINCFIEYRGINWKTFLTSLLIIGKHWWARFSSILMGLVKTQPKKTKPPR